jgi:hypothetical protein
LVHPDEVQSIVEPDMVVLLVDVVQIGYAGFTELPMRVTLALEAEQFLPWPDAAKKREAGKLRKKADHFLASIIASVIRKALLAICSLDITRQSRSV